MRCRKVGTSWCCPAYSRRAHAGHEFYVRFGSLSCVASLVDFHESEHGSALVLEYIRGQRLRRALLDSDITASPRRLRDLGDQLVKSLRELFTAGTDSALDAGNVASELMRIAKVLAVSGPNDTTPPSSEVVLNRALFVAHRPVLRRALDARVAALAGRPCVCHGDLHLDNVLVTERGDVRFVDFGRWHCGSAVEDAGYVGTAFRAATGGLAALDVAMEALLADVEVDVAAFRELQRLLRATVDLNSRFRLDAKGTSVAARFAFPFAMLGSLYRATWRQAWR